MRENFARLSLVATVTTYLLIILGGVVRATGAGLACPDWPLCHGRLIPPLEGLVLIEYSHRLLASIVGLLTLAVVISAWRLRGAVVLRRLSLLALVLVGVQIVLGGLTVTSALSVWLVVAHLGTAMAFFATLVVLTATAMIGGGSEAPPTDARFRRIALLTAGSTYGLVLIGGYVSASGAGLACLDWPLCGGQLVPALSGPVGAHVFHRVAAAAVGVLILATAVAAYRTQAHRPSLLAVSAIAVGLLGLQVILGALNIEYRLAIGATTAHLATATALFATLVILAVLAQWIPAGHLGESGLSAALPGSRMARVLDYVSLTKPRIIVLLLVTTAASMLIAAPGTVSPWLIASTLLGGALAAGSASTFNQLVERDIDAVMSRTRRRPIPAGRISPASAFAFGAMLGVFAFVVMAVSINLLTAILVLGALGFYILVYTVWLKRLTPQNIVIGGAAGAMPALGGWIVATGRVEVPALILFLIVFLWTPPHFWALSLYRRDDYARAGVPMLPVVAGEAVTRRQILLYSIALVGSTLLLYRVGPMGVIYAISALLLGVIFLALAVELWRSPRPGAAVRLFGYSVIYLALLFSAMVVDKLLRA
ncbi:MAG: protoheme IX farnesyltransferase [Armatimonadetes bacterium]|nr:protoheme IX farnesyltransferase [Armatimonadota bacterium]